MNKKEYGGYICFGCDTETDCPNCGGTDEECLSCGTVIRKEEQ